MTQMQKTASKAAGQTKAAKDAGPKLQGEVLYAYALPKSAMMTVVGKPAPPGVRMALVADSPAAAKRLVTWAPKAFEGKGKVLAAAGSGELTTGQRIEPAAYKPGPRARALLHGLEIAKSDLSEAGGAFDLEQVQEVLQISRQAIEKRVKEGSLLAVPGPSNRRRYPTIQFTREGVVAGLKAVQEALPTRNPWTTLNFFVRPDDRLDGRKPIDVLLEGKVELVVSAARGMGHQGG